MSTLALPAVPADLDDSPALTPAGERILATASALFYHRGIHAVGVDLIADEAGTTKKTLYDRFGSKDALVARYLIRRQQQWREALAAHLAESAPDPGIGQVLAVFDALDEWLADLGRGCAFVNAYAEFGGTGHPGLPVVAADKAYMRAVFVGLTEAAGVRDADRVGAQVHLLYEGALVQQSAGADPEAGSLARAAAAQLLRAGLPSSD